jgi:hypothetical protein
LPTTACSTSCSTGFSSVLKRSKYDDAGVASYRIVDPAVPSFVAYDLVAGSYVEVARASGSDTADVTLPLAASVVPSTLV